MNPREQAEKALAAFDAAVDDADIETVDDMALEVSDLAAALRSLLSAPQADEQAWEYGVTWRYNGEITGYPADDESAARAFVERDNADLSDGFETFVSRRTKMRSAGPWVPVEEDNR